MQKDNIKGVFDILNGLRSAGLGELVEVGLPEREFFVIPDAYMRKFTLRAAEEGKDAQKYEAITTYADTVKEKLSPNLVFDGEFVITSLGTKLTYALEPIPEATQDLIIATIIDAYKGIAEPQKTMKAAINVIALDNGWIQHYESSESRIIETLKDAGDKTVLNNFKAQIIKNAKSFNSLCIAGAINHWATNHTLGGGLRNTLIDRAYAFTTMNADFPMKGKTLRDNIYTVIHGIDKRNCLFTITDSIPELTGIITLGMHAPIKIECDKSIMLRVKSIPAGNRRIEVAIALMKFAADNDILGCSKTIANFNELLELKEKALSLGTRAHVGSKFYNAKRNGNFSYVDLVNSRVNDIIIDYGNVAIAIAPESTISMSPIVIAQVNANPRKPVVERARAILNEISVKAEEFAKAIQADYAKRVFSIEDSKKLIDSIDKYFNSNPESDKVFEAIKKAKEEEKE